MCSVDSGIIVVKRISLDIILPTNALHAPLHTECVLKSTF